MCELGSVIYHTKLKHSFLSGTDPRASCDDYEDAVSLLDPVEAEVPYEEVTVRV